MKSKINWNNELSAAFATPKPQKKERFLQTLRYPRLSYTGFFLSQLRYLRKRVWVLDALLIVISIILTIQPLEWLRWSTVSGNCWIVAAFLPFLALLAVTEMARSSCCYMAELEMSCRFSLQEVIMARMLLLGGGNGVVLISVLLLMGRLSSLGFGRLAFYLLTPYILTGALCLFLLNHVRGRESLYGCAAIASAVSILNSIAGSAVQVFYAADYIHWWMILAAVSICIMILQLYQLLKQTEGKQWNLPLIE